MREHSATAPNFESICRIRCEPLCREGSTRAASDIVDQHVAEMRSLATQCLDDARRRSESAATTAAALLGVETEIASCIAAAGPLVQAAVSTAAGTPGRFPQSAEQAQRAAAAFREHNRTAMETSAQQMQFATAVLSLLPAALAAVDEVRQRTQSMQQQWHDMQQSVGDVIACAAARSAVAAADREQQYYEEVRLQATLDASSAEEFLRESVHPSFRTF